MDIIELKYEYVEYVSEIIMKRWNQSKESALEEIQRWINHEDDSICFVGIIDKKPMATGVFDTISDVDFSIPCWNTLLWVEPENRGNDYGRLLTQKRFDHAKKLGYKTVYLDTVNAKNYHLKFGWIILREFDKEGEHYTIMKHDL